MRKKLCIWRNFALIILVFLISCRNEDFSNAAADSKREEEFFREALSKTARFKNGNNIVTALKRQNEKLHFVSKMKDQSGLPIWDKIITTKRSKILNKGEVGEGSEEYIIPLTENNKSLSSILYVTKYPDSSFVFKNIDNERAKEIVYDTEVERSLREQILASFIFVDNLSFSKDAVYWNIPNDLFSFIPESTTYPQRRFKVNIQNNDSGTNTGNLYEYEVDVICASFEIECDRCGEGGHTTYETYCWTTGGGGGGMPNGEGGNGGHGTPGDTGGGGGGGGNQDGSGGDEQDDCSLDNKPFYKIVPGCDDDGGSNEHGGIIDLCMNLKNQKNNTKFTNGINKLNGNLNLKKETGYLEKNNGNFEYKDNAGATETANTLALPDPDYYKDMKGYMHTHPNDFYGSDDLLRIGFKIFSPADVMYLNQLVKNAQTNNASLAEIYAVVVTSKGNYQIRFTGNVNQIKTIYTNTKDDYNKMYINYFHENEKRSDEVNFLKFIDEKMYVKGITLVKMNDDGTFTKKTLNADKTGVTNENCP